MANKKREKNEGNKKKNKTRVIHPKRIIIIIIINYGSQLEKALLKRNAFYN